MSTSVLMQGLGYAKNISCVVSLAVLLTAVFCLVGLRVNNGRLLSVQTASMRPTFSAGDAVLVQAYAGKKPRVGDVISYRSLRDPSVIVSHRLIAIDATTGLLHTAGDALQASDQPFQSARIVGRVQAVLPKLGSVLALLHTPLGLTVFVYLPALSLIGNEVRLLRKRLKPAAYTLHGYR